MDGGIIIAPSRDIAARHVELLTGSADTVCCFRLLRKREDIGQNLCGTVADVWTAIEDGQRQGWQPFIVVNEGGQTDQEINRVRALFVDADNRPVPAKWHAEPDFTVCRDETHWHAYWLVDDLPPAKFKAAQKRLAAYYGTDISVCNPSRVMRLAGSAHLKEPRRPMLVQIGQDRGARPPQMARTAAELLAGLPVVPDSHAERHAAPLGLVFDLPVNVDRARSYLKYAFADGPWGQDDPPDTYAIATVVKDTGISPEKTVDLMMEPLDEYEREWLTQTVDNAFRYGLNEPGCYALRDEIPQQWHDLASRWTVQGEIAAPEPADDDEGFPVFDTWQFKSRPPPAWLIDGLIRDKSLTIIFGKSETFKTFLLIDILASTAAGIPAFGHLDVRRPGDAVLCLDEDPDDAMRGRYPAWCAARDIADPFANPALRPDGTPFPGRYVTIPSVPLVSEPQSVERLIRQIRKAGLRPVIIAIDTAAKAMGGLNQNDAKDVGLLAAAMTRLRREFDCAVIAAHHPKKDDDAEMRGSGAFTNDFDAALHSERVSEMAVRLNFSRMKTTATLLPLHLRGALYDAGITDEAGKALTYPAFTYTSSPAPTAHPKADDGDSSAAFFKAPYIVALRELTSTSDEHVNTATFVGKLYPMEPKEDPDEYSTRIRLRHQELTRMAKAQPSPRQRSKDGILAEFTKRTPKGDQFNPYRWYLPDQYRGTDALDY